jgi:hypothetical protein
MKARRRAIARRDQGMSPFSAVLMRLCEAAGAVGAALVDPEGETVDYAGAIDPFDIKVTAAEWVILLGLLRNSRVPVLRETDEIALRAAKKSFLLKHLADGYAVVVVLPSHAFGVSRRGLAEAVRELCEEAGLALPSSTRQDADKWRRVEVLAVAADPRRPSAVWVGGAWSPVEILGRLTIGLGSREVGYRARLPTGAEITLIREPLGRWYSDSVLGK